MGLLGLYGGACARILTPETEIAMCGRFVQLPLQFPDRTPWPELAGELAAIGERYNLAPTQRAAVVLHDGEPEVRHLRWGLLPFWAKEANKLSTFNARIETVATKPAYRAAFKARRCIIPMAGYYEWVDTPSGKQPYYLTRKDGDTLFAAGLWEPRHALQDEDAEGSCTIVTSDATDEAGQVHDRMPVFLPPELCEHWMRAEPEEAMALLVAATVPPLEVRPVSRRVNSSRTPSSAELVEEVDPRAA
jgi:putative SOS response-associated peptidase YedK